MLYLIAFSIQAAYASVHGPNRNHNPNIFVPESSIPHWFDKPGTSHTQCLIWKGPTSSGGADLSAEVRPNLFGPLVSSPAGYGPNDVRSAYLLRTLQGAGTIAILDAYGYPNALQDFNAFSTQFGLPIETSNDQSASSNQVLQVISSSSGQTPPTDTGWDLEQSLDIEWVHAIAPQAKIILVQSMDNGNSLLESVPFAASLQGVQEVSMSFGASDGSWETAFEPYMGYNGVVEFAATGDAAGEVLFPSVSDNVVGVGGTSLYVANGVFEQEIGWSSEGGGVSSTSPLPAYQQFLASKFSNKVVPDLVAVADPGTGVAVYNSYYGGWIVVGGTSLATPVVAAITNDLQAGDASSSAFLTRSYGLLGSPFFRDITKGSTGLGLNAGPGWDNMSGIGAPLGLAITLKIPSPGLLKATQNGFVSYPFSASDPSYPNRTINTSVLAGPSWVSWSGSQIVISPPANAPSGTYPVVLSASESGFGYEVVRRNLMINVATPTLQSASWATASVKSGSSDNLTITLSNPAPQSGITVSLSSSTPLLKVGSVSASARTFANGVISITIPITALGAVKPIEALAYVSYGTKKLAVPVRITP